MSERPEEGKEGKLVYWLKSPLDLRNLVAGFPATPILSYRSKKWIYIVHSPGDLVFILEVEQPIEGIEAHFAAQTKLNCIEVERVKLMTNSELAKYLEEGQH